MNTRESHAASLPTKPHDPAQSLNYQNAISSEVSVASHGEPCSSSSNVRRDQHTRKKHGRHFPNICFLAAVRLGTFDGNGRLFALYFTIVPDARVGHQPLLASWCLSATVSILVPHVASPSSPAVTPAPQFLRQNRRMPQLPTTTAPNLPCPSPAPSARANGTDNVSQIPSILGPCRPLATL